MVDDRGEEEIKPAKYEGDSATQIVAFNDVERQRNGNGIGTCDKGGLCIQPLKTASVITDEPRGESKLRPGASEGDI